MIDGGRKRGKSEGQGYGSNEPTPPERTTTRKELSKMAGVSESTFKRAKKIMIFRWNEEKKIVETEG